MQDCIQAKNASAHLMSNAPILEFGDFQKAILDSISENTKLACLAAGRKRLAIAALADKESKTFRIYLSTFPESYPSMTPRCTQAHLFEREIAEQWGHFPIGHPWLKPVRFHSIWDPRGPGQPWANLGPGIQEYYKIDGRQIHEVAVGPVHAGVIEPGHFRFQCDGENVCHLEIALGYQHRGIERAMEGRPSKISQKMMETASGDASIGHGTAYCSLLEALMGIRPTERACILRALTLELERLANHVGDLGAMAQDIGFQPTSAYCGRLRGDILNITAEICGSRLGRDMLAIGGTHFDVHPSMAGGLLTKLSNIEDDVSEAVELLWGTSSVASRFEGTGAISKAQAIELGMVGPSARASGVDLDARRDFPLAPYDFIPMPIALEESGDVYSRAKIREAEIHASMRFAKAALHALQKMEASPAISGNAHRAKISPSSIAISAIEGWRGMIFHLAMTDENGQFERYKIVDPSFFNWQGLAMAVRGEGISDFPLCNKSFNLSYCGFDL
jgi:Ni,Fe-hydrogenase III large subunit